MINDRNSLRLLFIVGLRVAAHSASAAVRQCPIIGSPPPRKVFPGRQFTGKNPHRPAAAWARRIFTGKLSAGEDFSGGGRSCNGETFYGAGDILIRERHIKFVIISCRADFFMGETF